MTGKCAIRGWKPAPYMVRLVCYSMVHFILCVVGYGVRSVIAVGSSWLMWFVGAGLTGVIGLCINGVLILNKEERGILLGKVRSLVGKLKR